MPDWLSNVQTKNKTSTAPVGASSSTSTPGDWLSSVSSGKQSTYKPNVLVSTIQPVAAPVAPKESLGSIFKGTVRETKTIKQGFISALSSLKTFGALAIETGQKIVQPLPITQKAIDVTRKAQGKPELVSDRKTNIYGNNEKVIQASNKLLESAAKDQASIRKFLQENPLEADTKTFIQKIQDPRWVVRGLAMNLPNLGLVAAASIATGGAAALPASIALESGGFYQEAIDSGVDRDQARRLALSYGTLSGILESVVPGEWGEGAAITKATKKVLSKELVSIAKTGATEAATESAQELLANVFKKTYDQNQGLFEGIPESAFFGLLLGAGVGAGIDATQAGIDGVRNKIITPDQAISTVSDNNLQDTKTGKEIIKAAIVAKQNNQNIQISVPIDGDIEIETTSANPGETGVASLSRDSVENVTLFRGSKGKVSKQVKSFNSVLVVDGNQRTLIEKMADDGNKTAQKILDDSPQGRVDFTVADPLIAKEFSDEFDAIRYENSQMPQIGIEYHDLKTNEFLAENEDLAKLYASQKRGDKYQKTQTEIRFLEEQLSDLRRRQDSVESAEIARLLSSDIEATEAKLAAAKHDLSLTETKQKVKTSDESIEVSELEIPNSLSELATEAKQMRSFYEFQQKYGYLFTKDDDLAFKGTARQFYDLAVQESIEAEKMGEVSTVVKKTVDQINQPLRDYYNQQIQENEEAFGEAHARVWEELDISKAGERFFDDSGRVIGSSPSTFPSWVPDYLRLRSLFDKILSDFTDLTKITFPPNSQPRMQDLYETILAKVDDLAGTDTSLIIEKIKEDYARQKEIAKNGSKEVVRERPGGVETARKPKVSTPQERSKASTKPVTTVSGVKKESRAYKRVRERIEEQFQDDVTYNSLRIAEETAKALNFVDKFPDQAIRIAKGIEQPPAGYTETAISITAAERALETGDKKLHSRLEASRSLRQTRRGQEIVMEKGRFNASSPHRFVSQVLKARLEKAASASHILFEVADRITGQGKTRARRAVEEIDTKAQALKRKIDKETLSKLQSAQDIINKLTCKI